MCTLTAFFEAGDSASRKFVVTMNRDESLERSESTPLFSEESGQGSWRYWHPVDGAAGGTWFGVHANGWVLALLNRYQDQQTVQSDAVTSRRVKTSRGHLIPSLLQYDDFSQLKKALLSLRLENYSPCDLWCFSPTERIQVSWSGQRHMRSTNTSNSPFFTYSSSTDVEEAGHYRKAQFQRFLEGTRSAEHALVDLHQDPCSHNASLGFNMSRPGRHTKSICQAILGEGAPSLHYMTRDSNDDFIQYVPSNTKMSAVS